MNAENLRLKRKIFQKVHLDLQVVHRRIIAELQKGEYQIIEQNAKLISFDDCGPQLYKVMVASLSKLENGVFDLKLLEQQDILKLTYYVSYKFVLFSVLAILVIAYFYGAILLVPAGFLLLAFVVHVFMQKSNAICLFEKVVKIKISNEVDDPHSY